jgi:hypothetical protein
MEEIYIVYGLRLKNEREVRYVGETTKRLLDRLIQHTSSAVMGRVGGEFADWLLSNRGEVEIFEIARCEDRKHAQETEKVVIAECQRLGQRIFNRKHAGKYGSYKVKVAA